MRTTTGPRETGPFSFSVVATDSKGASTTSGTQTIQVVRCDSPARIGAGLSSPPSNQNGGYAWASCPSPVTVTFAITALDPDSPNGPLQVQVAWSIVDSDGVRRPQSGVVNANQLKGSSYSATIPASLTSGWCDANSGFYGSGNQLTFTITTTDQFGGVTRGRPLTVSLDIYCPGDVVLMNLPFGILHSLRPCRRDRRRRGARRGRRDRRAGVERDPGSGVVPADLRHRRPAGGDVRDHRDPRPGTGQAQRAPGRPDAPAGGVRRAGLDPDDRQSGVSAGLAGCGRLPARRADLAVRRGPAPGVQLHDGRRRDARAAWLRHRDDRLPAPRAPARPGGRHVAVGSRGGDRPLRRLVQPGAHLVSSSFARCSTPAPGQWSRAATATCRSTCGFRRTSRPGTPSTSTGSGRRPPMDPRPTTCWTRWVRPGRGIAAAGGRPTSWKAFATAFGGGSIYAAWAFPGGHTPTSYPVLPPDAYPSPTPEGQTPSLAPGATLPPSPLPASAPVPSGEVPSASPPLLPSPDPSASIPPSASSPVPLPLGLLELRRAPGPQAEAWT